MYLAVSLWNCLPIIRTNEGNAIYYKVKFTGYNLTDFYEGVH